MEEEKGEKGANETESKKGECHLLLTVPVLMVPVWMPGFHPSPRVVPLLHSSYPPNPLFSH